MIPATCYTIRNNSPNAHKAGKQLALHLTTSHPNERRKSRQKKKPLPWITPRKEAKTIEKGYFVPCGYMGFVPWLNRYQLFATEQDYQEYIS